MACAGTLGLPSRTGRLTTEGSAKSPEAQGGDGQLADEQIEQVSDDVLTDEHLEQAGGGVSLIGTVLPPQGGLPRINNE